MTPSCPTCDARGRRVSAVTVGSHVLPEALAPRAGASEDPDGDPAAGWWLCRDAECATIYFRGEDTLAAASVDTVPFHKNADDPTQLVCFCFQHTVSAVLADAQEHGTSTIRAAIQAGCARGDDDCERTNPQGRCCLGNVGAVAAAVTGPRPAPSARPAAASSPFIILPTRGGGHGEDAATGGGCGDACTCGRSSGAEEAAP